MKGKLPSVWEVGEWSKVNYYLGWRDGDSNHRIGRVTQMPVQHGRVKRFLPLQDCHPTHWGMVTKQHLWKWRQDAGTTYPSNCPPKLFITLQILLADRNKHVMETRIRLSRNNPKVFNLFTYERGPKEKPELSSGGWAPCSTGFPH